IEEYFFDDPSKLDYGVIEHAFNLTGEFGICEGIVGNTFFEFLTTFREGGAIQVILDLNDNPEFFLPLQKRYIEQLTAIAEEIIRNTGVDVIFVNCGTASLDTISPAVFKKWDIPLLESIGKVAAKHRKIFHYHLHGKGRALLEDIVNAGVNVICPLEQHPLGDFDLREVKDRFGDRLALKGNINPFFPLRDGSTEDVEKAVIECINSAAEGGGFTLASADGVLSDTPFENIFAMVDAGKRYGRYV
ncbi:MAG: uroporphyrinogen decarboxylase family protein, partial [Chitinophagaceae bacterium]